MESSEEVKEITKNLEKCTGGEMLGQVGCKVRKSISEEMAFELRTVKGGPATGRAFLEERTASVMFLRRK